MTRRSLSVDEAAKLRAGDDHYRAYVGPPQRYDFMGLSQIGILFALDLKETDKVLDFGCGSLRAGRMLIPFLREECYFGIDSNRWLIDDGIDRELGRDAIDLKRPRFSYNDDFNCAVFNQQFDFIMAQSIVTHAGPSMARALFRTAFDSLKQDGLLLLSYVRGTADTSMPPDGWSYPDNIVYSPDTIMSMLGDVGFAAVEIPWFHPGAQWVAASPNAERLPTREALTAFAGQPIPRRRPDPK